MKKNKLNIGLAGFGTVGSGLAKMIAMNKEWIINRTGCEVVLKAVADLDESKKSEVETFGAVFYSDANKLVDDPEIDVFVELIGGIKIAKQFIEKALQAGKHVVTANKALLAEEGHDLFKLAGEKGLHLCYEASVAGGIPIVQNIKENLAGNRILRILGILNGTANFILSQMSEHGTPFDEALKSAQEKGYAEADPTLDIEGFDAAHKLVLLIRLAFGLDYPFGKLSVSGISSIDIMDIGFASELGYEIKLIGQADLVEDNKVVAGLFPALVHKDFLLAAVKGSFNAVRLEGNGGPVMLYGYGAGDIPTGSAVLSDIMTIARGAEPNNTGFIQQDLPPADRLDLADSVSKFYMRFFVPDRPGVLRDIGGYLADNDISLAQVLQKGEDAGKGVPLVMLTHNAKAKNVETSLKAVREQGLMLTDPVVFRIL